MQGSQASRCIRDSPGFQRLSRLISPESVNIPVFLLLLVVLVAVIIEITGRVKDVPEASVCTCAWGGWGEGEVGGHFKINYALWFSWKTSPNIVHPLRYVASLRPAQKTQLANSVPHPPPHHPHAHVGLNVLCPLLSRSASAPSFQKLRPHPILFFSPKLQWR